MNEKNLVQNKGLSPNEARENGRKGGMESAKSRQKRKLLREHAEEIMNLPVTKDNKDAIELLSDFGLDASEETLSTVMLCALMKKALQGDSKAIQAITEIADGDGNKEIEKELKKAELELRRIAVKEKESAHAFDMFF